MLLWPGTGEGGKERERRKETGRRIVLEFCVQFNNVPCAQCEEVTLRPHVPHRLLPGDRCAEHGPQEYGTAAGKGHTEEPPGSVHTEDTCRH